VPFRELHPSDRKRTRQDVPCTGTYHRTRPSRPSSKRTKLYRYQQESIVTRKPLSTEEILGVLAQTPQRIAEFTDGLTLDQLRTAPAPGEWSVNELLAHLRACADVWGNCITHILEQDTPTLRAVNPRTWIESTDYPTQAFSRLFGAFAAQRASLLAVLKPLTSKAWTLNATVTGAGSPLELTLHSYAQRMAIHERPHVKQIRRIVNAVRKWQEPSHFV
jgi:hypothetical protein